MHVLRIDASARTEASVSRAVTDRFIESLGAEDVTRRDLSLGLPLVDGAWVAANGRPEEERDAADAAALALSDTLIAEIEAADILVIGMPVYNFGVPAALKAWVDLICRARRTFAYTEEGPRGLLRGKRAVVVYTSGGTPMGAQVDFASGFMRHVLGFVGIEDVQMVAAEQVVMDEGAVDAALAAAQTLATQMRAEAGGAQV